MRICCLSLWLCGFVMVIGCGPREVPDAAQFGRFEGDVVASWDADGRNMTLREDFAYVDARNRRWKAPAGAVVNGASIPAAFWSFIGGPFEGKYRTASVVHDVGCMEMTASWEDVHRMFYEACRCGGVDEAKAKVLYYAVYHFGPRWQPVTETRIETGTNNDGKVVQERRAVKRMVRIDPPPPTLEEVEQVQALIAEENPQPSVIETTDRETLRRRPRRGAGRGRATGGSANTSSTVEGFDRAGSQRPEGTQGRHGSDGQRREGVEGRGPAGSEWTGGFKRHKGADGERAGEPSTAPALPAVTLEEQQWAAQQVSQYLEQQTGQQRPAKFDVERTEDGYRIFVQYLQLDEQGQPTENVGGNSTVRLSKDGQVLEMISSM